MSIFAIFKTKKESGECAFVGQTSSQDVPSLLQTAAKVTGEKPVSFRKGQDVTTVTTPNSFVDIYPKDNCGDIFSNSNVPL